MPSTAFAPLVRNSAAGDKIQVAGLKRYDFGNRMQERAERKRLEEEAELLRIEAEEAAERQAERQRIAEAKYAEVDLDGDQSISRAELETLVLQILTEQGIELERDVAEAFAKQQFEVADLDKDGYVSFEEFSQFYFKLVENLEAKIIREQLEAENKRVTAAREATQGEHDHGDMEALLGLLRMLTHPSIAPATGTRLDFELDADGVRPAAAPPLSDERTSRGVVLDLSMHDQRLITPWGAYPISYALAFPGYNEGAERDVVEASALEGLATTSFYFCLSRDGASPLLSFRKHAERPLFFLASALGQGVEAGEVLGERDVGVTVETRAALTQRFHSALSATATPAAPGTWAVAPQEPLLDPNNPTPSHHRLGHRHGSAAAEAAPAEVAPDPFLLNALLGTTAVVADNLLPLLEARMRRSRFRPRGEVLRTALVLASNDLQEAARQRQEHQRHLDRLVAERRGYSTREHCAAALDACRWDVDVALWLLDHESSVHITVDAIQERIGLASGLGFPSREEIQWHVALARNDQAAATRAISDRWAADVRMMRETVRYAPVDRVMQRAVQLHRPGRLHIERLLQAFNGDDSFVNSLLEETAIILSEREELGRPSRLRVESLVRHFDLDGEKVRAFLRSAEYIYRNRRLVGSPSRAEIERYLEQFDYDQKRALRHMKTVFKFIDPRPPVTPPVKTDALSAKRLFEGKVVRHIAKDCELLQTRTGAAQPWARRSVETALAATKSEEEAVAFLVKVARLHENAKDLPRWELEFACARAYKELHHRMPSPETDLDRVRARTPNGDLIGARPTTSPSPPPTVRVLDGPKPRVLDGLKARDATPQDVLSRSLEMPRPIRPGSSGPGGGLRPTTPPGLSSAGATRRASLAASLDGPGKHSNASSRRNSLTVDSAAAAGTRSRRSSRSSQSSADEDLGEVTLDQAMAQWRAFDEFARRMVDVGAVERRRIAALLETLAYDQARVESRLRAMQEVRRVSVENELGLGEHQMQTLLVRYNWDTTHVKRYLLGMQILRARAHQFGSPSARQLEGTLLRYSLNVEHAYRHLRCVTQLQADEAFLADAGRPTLVEIDRALELMDHDFERTKELLRSVMDVMRDSKRWGCPSREHVERTLVDEDLDKDAALSQIREQYRADQYDKFRADQAWRRARRKSEAMAFVIARPPPDWTSSNSAELETDLAATHGEVVSLEEMRADSRSSGLGDLPPLAVPSASHLRAGTAATGTGAVLAAGRPRSASTSRPRRSSMF